MNYEKIMFIGKLNDKEILDIVDKLSASYDALYQFGYVTNSKNEITRTSNQIIVSLSDGNFNYNVIIFDDFEAASSCFYQKRKENVIADFRQIMYQKFGEKYLSALKKHLKNERKEEIKKFKDKTSKKMNNIINDIELNK